jgi:hypothetical protein
MKLIYGQEVEVKAGSHIEPDGWYVGQALVPSHWERADFYLSTGRAHGVTQVAVNIQITGRTLRRRMGSLYVRVKITLVGDGEPDREHGGWLLVA